MPTKTKRCTHYWLIDDKNKGICKYCGAERQFPVWHDRDYKWRTGMPDTLDLDLLIRDSDE